VVCKASDEIHKKALLKVGADRVVIPEKEMAGRVARGLATPNVMDYIELSGQFAIVERSAPESWIGKSLKDLNVRNKYGLSIIAFRRGRDMIVSPRPDEPIAPGDVLIVLGREDDLARLKK
jgi:trk system potassium uptake protein TrkA